jgi:hypothetical protein
MHATPLVPQASLLVPALHVWVAASQHPVGQLAGVQTHDPSWHSVPAGHPMQVRPAVPHAWSVLPGLQVLFSQQPAQLAGVQTQDPFWHSVPAGQEIQAAPPVPQNSFALPGRHVCVVSSQHPLEQLAVVQAQTPS